MLFVSQNIPVGAVQRHQYFFSNGQDPTFANVFCQSSGGTWSRSRWCKKVYYQQCSTSQHTQNLSPITKGWRRAKVGESHLEQKVRYAAFMSVVKAWIDCLDLGHLVAKAWIRPFSGKKMQKSTSKSVQFRLTPSGWSLTLHTRSSKEIAVQAATTANRTRAGIW
jgi:hypothetical protein